MCKHKPPGPHGSHTSDSQSEAFSGLSQIFILMLPAESNVLMTVRIQQFHRRRLWPADVSLNVQPGFPSASGVPPDSQSSICFLMPVTAAANQPMGAFSSTCSCTCKQLKPPSATLQPASQSAGKNGANQDRPEVCERICGYNESS